MREQFREQKFYKKSKISLNQLLAIIDDSLSHGIESFTERQLYYQMVTRNFIRNIDKEYSRITRLITNARYAGLIDWNLIEDRVRVSVMPPEWDNIGDLIECATSDYAKQRWKGQEYYLQVITEKNALRSVLLPITEKYHVSFTAYTGYGSASIIYRLSKELIYYTIKEDRTPVIAYIGDFDPSGLNMRDDINNRISEFVKPYFDPSEIIYKDIGLTLEQIREFDLPPNPVKETDTRAKGFIEKYGRESWEADALPPTEMRNRLEETILSFIGCDGMNEVIESEKGDKKILEGLAKEYKEAEK